MKALISPNESFTLTWISSWSGDEPVYSEILYCQRVAEVEPNDKVFGVAEPLHWVDCPDDCVADQWYYKDGQVQIKPQNTPVPEGE
jgi:hypothetical protein